MKLNFAKAVFCCGTWFVRMGCEHGIDVMFEQKTSNDNEAMAKLRARLINQSLNRDIKKWETRRKNRK